ncbi:YvrJ family protein [Lentibacillus cibarius]|nr:YvrJ family protein [Lentibacillus cibarius]
MQCHDWVMKRLGKGGGMGISVQRESMMSTDLSAWTSLLEMWVPIFIAAYLLLRFEKKINNLSDTLDELKELIRNHRK